jgi:histidinol-phosphatase
MKSNLLARFVLISILVLLTQESCKYPDFSSEYAIERRLRELIATYRPRDAILGEELGASGASERRWLLDPIDGTFNLVSGKPQWGTHVALLQEDHVALGVITRPVLGQSWSACRGRGAYRENIASPSNAAPLRVSRTSELHASRVTAWSHNQDPAAVRLKRNAVWVEPDLDAMLRLAEGELEAVIALNGKPWDLAPAAVIVEEAGGRYSDKNGGHRVDLGEGRYSNGLIHRQLEELPTRCHAVYPKSRRRPGE